MVQIADDFYKQHDNFSWIWKQIFNFSSNRKSIRNIYILVLCFINSAIVSKRRTV